MIELINVSRTVTSGAGPLTILHPTSLRFERGQAVAHDDAPQFAVHEREIIGSMAA